MFNGIHLISYRTFLKMFTKSPIADNYLIFLLQGFVIHLITELIGQSKGIFFFPQELHQRCTSQFSGH